MAGVRMALATDGTDVFFTDVAMTGLFRAPANGGKAMHYAGNPVMPQLVMDDRSV